VSGPHRDPQLASAYAECLRLARTHYENFPVASLLLPWRMRPHIAAVYAFARTADDFADEGSRTVEERNRLLDAWLERLRASAGTNGASAPAASPDDRIFLALGDTIRRCRLPVSLFEDLLSAFRQDTTTTRYETWDDVLDYCRRSANPVGRIVLRVAGYEDATLDRSSDALCTALQLTNFWQDLAFDWARGRLYVPAAERRACGARESALDAGRIDATWRCALQRATVTTRDLFRGGRHVCERVGGRLGLELRVTWLGGMTILERIEAGSFDVFRNRPRLGTRDVVPMLWRAVRWREG
jgi:hydroxysqualene synthase